MRSGRVVYSTFLEINTHIGIVRRYSFAANASSYIFPSVPFREQFYKLFFFNLELFQNLELQTSRGRMTDSRPVIIIAKTSAVKTSKEPLYLRKVWSWYFSTIVEENEERLMSYDQVKNKSYIE